MRRSVFYVLFFFACLLCQNAEAKVKQKPIYIFGFAASFTDSIGYVTDVQYLDSAYVDTKNKFLIGRNMYSVQLQQYLQENMDCKNPITSIFFGEKKEKLQKKQLSVRRRYEKYKDYTVKTAGCVFAPVPYIEQEPMDFPAPEKIRKKHKKR
ncbi:MAG: hypothetical protein J5524_09940 [Bacteroidaceae bacterium]|nr:hypothetical protein [Bacteroidaceae bacterium]